MTRKSTSPTRPLPMTRISLPRVIPFTVCLALCLLTSNCKRADKVPSLYQRIVTARGSAICTDSICANPHLLALETEYIVTTFEGSKPHQATLPTKKLAEYLQALPMQAWPRGPSITISPTDVVIHSHAVEDSFLAAQRLCRSLGLQVEVRPGG